MPWGWFSSAETENLVRYDGNKNGDKKSSREEPDLKCQAYSFLCCNGPVKRLMENLLENLKIGFELEIFF